MSFLHIRVVEAIGLAPTDLNGFADPYCKLQLIGVSGGDTQIQRTQTKKKSTNPIWDEYFSFKCLEKDLSHAKLHIYLYDWDSKSKDDCMGFAALDLSIFKSETIFEGWLPVRGSNRMKNKQQFREEILNLQHDLEQTETKIDGIQRTPTDFDYITQNTDLAAAQDRELSSSQGSSNSTNNNSNNNNNSGNNNGNNLGVVDRGNYTFGSNDNNNNNSNNNNNDYITQSKPITSNLNPNNNRKNNKNNNNSNNNSGNNSANISKSNSLQASPNFGPKRTLFAKSRDIDEDTLLNANGGKLPTGRKLAKAASRYDKSGQMLLADEEKTNYEYDYSYGVRDTDSGRLFIVARFEKMQSFGAVDAKVLLQRGREKLKVFPNKTESFPMQIYCATFNCGNSKMQDLYDWIPKDDTIDLYVIALQEMKQKKDKVRVNSGGSAAQVGYGSDNEDITFDNLMHNGSDITGPHAGGSSSNLSNSNNNQNNTNQNNTNHKNSNTLDYSPNLTTHNNVSNNSTSSNTNNNNNIPPNTNLAASISEMEVDDSMFDLEAVRSQQEEFEHLLINHLGTEYKTVGNHKMWMIRLFIFAKKEFDERISNVTAHHRAAGVGGVGRNKGAVVISLDFDGVSLCFVCAHLTAHQHKTEERNKMYKTICKHIKVGWPKQQLLAQFHHTFWMGDLNYRVDFEGVKTHDKTPKLETFNAFVKEVDEGNYDQLLQNCQLKKCMHRRNAFVGFQEGKIKFPPTFKVERNVKELRYLNTRLPAWCDRILFKSEDGYKLKYKEYNCDETVSVSDHKPVFCRFYLESWKRAPSISDACKSCTVVFSEVSASNLIAADINGTSDPFLHFPRQLLLSKFVASKRCNRTLDPKWKDKKMKELPLIRNSLPFLSKSLLLLQIRDHDTFSSNDIIAYGCIGLKNAVERMNEWVDFRIILTLDGKDAGTLQGKIKLVYEVYAEYDPKNRPKV